MLWKSIRNSLRRACLHWPVINENPEECNEAIAGIAKVWSELMEFPVAVAGSRSILWVCTMLCDNGQFWQLHCRHRKWKWTQKRKQRRFFVHILRGGWCTRTGLALLRECDRLWPQLLLQLFRQHRKVRTIRGSKFDQAEKTGLFHTKIRQFDE